MSNSKPENLNLNFPSLGMRSKVRGRKAIKGDRLEVVV